MRAWRRAKFGGGSNFGRETCGAPSMPGAVCGAAEAGASSRGQKTQRPSDKNSLHLAQRGFPAPLRCGLPAMRVCVDNEFLSRKVCGAGDLTHKRGRHCLHARPSAGRRGPPCSALRCFRARFPMQRAGGPVPACLLPQEKYAAAHAPMFMFQVVLHTLRTSSKKVCSASLGYVHTTGGIAYFSYFSYFLKS